MPLDGSGPPEQLASAPEDEFQPDFSADGKYIGFHLTRSGAARDLYVIPSAGGQRERVEAATENNFAPHLSPDGQAMVYNCPRPEGGRLCATRRSTNPAQTSSLFIILAAGSPDWSPDGLRISYVQANRLFWVAPDGKDPRGLRPLPAGFASFYTRWSRDSRTIYLSGLTADGRLLVYAASLGGGPLREVAHSEGPTYQSYRFGFDVHGSTLFVSLAQPQSDVWMAEVVRR